MVRIAHAPTNRAIKSTDALIAVVEAFRAEGLPVELDLIEQVTLGECLARKAAADIYFDQVILGYGCNAIEAWGMGIPVIAGADPWTLERMRREFDGRLPFLVATEETIADVLRRWWSAPTCGPRWGPVGHGARRALPRRGALRSSGWSTSTCGRSPGAPRTRPAAQRRQCRGSGIVVSIDWTDRRRAVASALRARGVESDLLDADLTAYARAAIEEIVGPGIGPTTGLIRSTVGRPCLLVSPPIARHSYHRVTEAGHRARGRYE